MTNDITKINVFNTSKLPTDRHTDQQTDRQIYNVPGVVGHHLGNTGISSHQAVDVGGLLELVR